MATLSGPHSSQPRQAQLLPSKARHLQQIFPPQYTVGFFSHHIFQVPVLLHECSCLSGLKRCILNAAQNECDCMNAINHPSAVAPGARRRVKHCSCQGSGITVSLRVECRLAAASGSVSVPAGCNLAGRIGCPLRIELAQKGAGESVVK